MKQEVSFSKVMILSRLEVINNWETRDGRATKDVSDMKGHFINRILYLKVEIKTCKFYYMTEIK